jgi:hypothetical protein
MTILSPIHNLLFIALSLTCSSDAFAADLKLPEKIEINLKSEKGLPDLMRYSPSWQLYQFSNEQVWLQFDFTERPFESKDVLKAIKDHFKYSNIEICLPQLATATKQYFTQLRGPLRDLNTAKSFGNMKDLKLSIADYKEGRLTGTLTGTITYLTTKTIGRHLETGDILGASHKDSPVNIPFTINFDLIVGPNNKTLSEY